MERLHKVLARAGVASRRAAEALIAAGRVSVNGTVITSQGHRVDPAHDQISVDGKAIPVAPAPVVILVNKPAGVVSTSADPQHRPTVLDLVGPQPVRLFPVGRLDLDSEGLLLLTNDGDLANRLTHPRFAVEKEYHVLVDRPVSPEILSLLHQGVRIADRMATPDRVEVLHQPPAGRWLRFILHEGRKREVRELCTMAGLQVLRLIRVRIGGLTLGKTATGEWRLLTPAEMTRLIGEQSPRRTRAATSILISGGRQAQR